MGTGRATGGTPSCCGAVTPGPRGDFLRAQAWLKPLDAAPKGATCFAGWASFHVHAREQYCDSPSVQVAGGASIGALHLALPRVAGCEVDGGDAWALRAEAYGSRAEGPGGGRAKPTSASASDGPVLVLDGAPYSVDWSQMRGAVTGTLGGLEPPLPGRGGGRKRKRKRRRGTAGGGGAASGFGGAPSQGPGEAAAQYATFIFPHVCLNLFYRGAGKAQWQTQADNLESFLREAVESKIRMSGVPQQEDMKPGASPAAAVEQPSSGLCKSVSQDEPNLFETWVKYADAMSEVQPDMPKERVWSLLSLAADLRCQLDSMKGNSQVGSDAALETTCDITHKFVKECGRNVGDPTEGLELLVRDLESRFRARTNELHCALCGF